MPVGVLEAAAAAGTRGDRGRLLGAGDGGLFLGFGVLKRRDEREVEVKYESKRELVAQEMWFHSSAGKSNEVTSVLHKAINWVMWKI